MRLLMITPYYLPKIGGVERHVHEIATRLGRRSDFNVTIVTARYDAELPEFEQHDGFEVRRIAARPHGRDWLFTPELPRLVATGGWDVVHIQSYHTLVAPLAMASAARAHLPYVVTFHGGGHSARIRGELRHLQRRMLRPLLARARALVAVAQFEIDQYASELHLPRERFALIPNGVDLPPPPPGDEAPAERAAGPLIASVGRLERYKGHHRVIEALPFVREAFPDAHLWIAGSGPFEMALRRLAAERGVEDAVEIGAVPPDARGEMARRLTETDLVVLLSEFETHPIAALEALSLGRPLLVGSGSGLGELAERGLARAVDGSAGAREVADAIVRELRDPLVPPPTTLPTWDDCATALIALYRSVAA